MENATKALIIAGAVLVSILLISVGVALINNNKGVTNSAKNTADAMNGAATNASKNVVSDLTSI